MSFVIAAPEYVAAAATDLSYIGSAISSANRAAVIDARWLTSGDAILM